MRQTNRCINIPSKRWRDSFRSLPSDELDNYLVELFRPAREGGELPNMLDLSEDTPSDIDIMSPEGLRMYRAIASDLKPFKIGFCSCSQCCCGCCLRKCSVRCVQDVVQRVYFLCNNVHKGFVSMDEAPQVIKFLYQAAMSPKVTYLGIVDILNYCLEGGYFNYECQAEYDEKGKKKTDPVTGEVQLLSWPRTGMCPFCVPRVLYHKVRRKRRDE